MKWTAKKAQQYVTFYTGLLAQGVGLTADEKKTLSSASNFLRQVRKGSRRNPGTLPKGLGLRCQCADSGCPVHEGSSTCGKKATSKLYRVDMDDRTGTLMCSGCGDDAMASGLFAARPIRNPGVLAKSKANNRGRSPAGNPVQIYGEVEQIKARKLRGRFKGQRFFHDFDSKAFAYGLPNGDVLLTTRKLK